ncbi:ribonuclease M5 [Bacilli bacterium PM5-3]|nr:ribonuclease M5 [Bacilli bacterium PM5-3]MDH6603039.1 ribonuclease M5 [Bacilli bacterium PM5-9]
MKINEVIVVEGEHDASRLKQLFDVEVIVTNGSEISSDTLNLIKKVNETKGVIIFCDPDYPGEQIRNKIITVVKNAKHAFIKKEDAIDHVKHKVGVEHASDEVIYKALENVVTFKNDETLTWNNFIKLDMIGNKTKRIKLCDKLNIGYCNAKTLFKRLNMLSLEYHDIVKILEDANE